MGIYDYAIFPDRGEWQVWALAPMTGDKRDLIEWHQTRTQALAHIDRLRSARYNAAKD